VGWSTGAVHATTLAAWAPAEVEAILLCMPAGFFPQSAFGHLIPNFTRTTLTTLGNPVHREMIQGGRALDLNRELLLSLAKLPAIAQMCGLLATDCAVRYAAEVRCRVGFVLARGDIVFDALIPMAERGELQALFPHAPSVAVHILEGANHNAFSTHSAEVAPIILDTLSQAGT
jgi:pimeloyl-ACP methyl ester carboxylesterase